MRHRRLAATLILLGILALAGGSAVARPLFEGTSVPCACSVSASDVPDDGGGAISVSWDLATTDASLAVTRFEILRYAAGEEPVSIGEVLSTNTDFTDIDANDGTTYQYIVRTHTRDAFTDSVPSDAALATAQWFAHGRAPSLIALILVCGSIIFFIIRAKGGAKIGIVFIMVSFGASFGYTLMARISLLIGRLYFLFHDLLHILD